MQINWSVRSSLEMSPLAVTNLVRQDVKPVECHLPNNVTIWNRIKGRQLPQRQVMPYAEDSVSKSPKPFVREEVFARGHKESQACKGSQLIKKPQAYMDSNKAGTTANLSQLSNVKEAEGNNVKRKCCSDFSRFYHTGRELEDPRPYSCA